MTTRQYQARNVRHLAADLAHARPYAKHTSNGEEYRYRHGGVGKGKPTFLATFTKGLSHDEHGFLFDPDHYELFVLGIQSGDVRDFERTPLGPPDTIGNSPQWRSKLATNANAKVRGWESSGAGHTFDLQGPDAQANTMPPAPRLDSDELIGEMAEVYLMALLRDVPFSQFRDDAPQHADDFKVVAALKALNGLDWFSDEPTHLNAAERLRQRGQLTRQTLFRGLAPGDGVGPHLSQFLLLGNRGVNGSDSAQAATDGYVSYGAIRIDQRVRVATPGKDYMTTFEQWLDVQNGADLRGQESYVPNSAQGSGYRFMATPRDLATYVHYDALYEAYLNACLMLLATGAPFDPGVPFGTSDHLDKQQGFAQFGGPHILSLVTEVATRALKAVRYQKFNVHRRARPEAIGGLINLYKNKTHVDPRLAPVQPLFDALDGATYGGNSLLDAVAAHNAVQNLEADRHHDASADQPSCLLPMAFPEGSPMHPSYGAGHATVAGACVTILKAFFDHGYPLSDALGGVWEAAEDGGSLVEVTGAPTLTVEGELNKLAANIAIGRDWAGVHYYTDYIESLRLGEQIALGVLEEQRLTYSENFSMTVPLFDGGTIRI